jgi:hypothetical protein
MTGRAPRRGSGRRDHPGERDRTARKDAPDPGSFIGRLPERAEDTIPGGIGPKDERVSAFDTQTGAKSPEPETPEGHREGEQATDDTIREAGENR